MKRLIPAIAVLAVLVVVIVGQAAGIGSSTPTTPSAATPRWVTHAARYPGGISGTVRAVYAARGQSGAAKCLGEAGSSRTRGSERPDERRQQPAAAPERDRGRLQRDATRWSRSPRRTTTSAAAWWSCGPSDGGRHWAHHPDHARSSAGPATSAAAATRASPTAAGTTRSTSRSCASSARCRSPRCRSTSRSTTARPGRPGRQAARAASNFDYTTGDGRRVDLQRQGAHRRRQHPDQPALRAALRDLHQVPHRSRTGSATTARSSSPTPTRSRPSNPALSTWSHTAVQPDDPGGDGTGAVGQPVQRARWSRRTARSTSGSSPRTATTRSTRTCSSRSRPTAGRRSCRSAVQIDKPGQYADFDDGTGRHAAAHAFPRAEHAVAGLQPADRQRCCTSTRTTSTGRSRAPTSPTRRPTDGGLHWSDAALPVDHDRSGSPAGNDQFFPWAASDENGRLLRDLVRPPARPGQRAASTPGRRCRATTRRSFASAKISTQRLGPEPGVLHQRRVHRRLQRARRQHRGRLPGVDRRPRQRHRPDRHRRDRHLHQVPEEPVAGSL